MTYEQAIYYKYLLICGYSDELDQYISTALEIEDPVSNIVLNLSTCGSDNKTVLRVLHDYIISMPDGQIDHNKVFDLFLSFLRKKYIEEKMPIEQLTKLMHQISLLTEDSTVNPWWTMNVLDDLYSEAKMGFISMDSFMGMFERFLNEGRCIESSIVHAPKKQYTPTKKKIITIIGIAITCLIVALGCIFGIQYYRENNFTFTVADTLPDGNGKEATVILLGGQSNASGCSLDEYLKRNVSAEKYAEYQSGYDNVYINFLSGSRTSQGFVKCATLQGEPEGTFGPELGLAEKLHELYSDRTFFIIKYAWGGTNLYEQWLSPSSFGKTGKLYKQFVAYVKTSVEYLKSKNYDVKIEGMCWMQGESDALSVKASTGYAKHLENFIADIRKEFSQYAPEDGIAFVDAYIAANPAYWVYYESVNQGKLEVAQRSSMNALVDTITARLTCSKEPEGDPDMAHYDSMSQIKLGHLFGQQIAKFLD